MARGSILPQTVMGVVAYVTSVAATWYYLPDEQPIQFALEVSDATLAAWYHYSANFVTVIESVNGNLSFRTGGVNLISQTGDPNLELLYAFPVAACLLAGALAAATSRGAPVVNGGTIALGYAGSMVVGAYLFSIRGGGLGITARMGPAYGEAAIFGFVIAAVAGAVGGLLYAIVS